MLNTKNVKLEQQDEIPQERNAESDLRPNKSTSADT